MDTRYVRQRIHVWGGINIVYEIEDIGIQRREVTEALSLFPVDRVTSSDNSTQNPPPVDLFVRYGYHGESQQVDIVPMGQEYRVSLTRSGQLGHDVEFPEYLEDRLRISVVDNLTENKGAYTGTGHTLTFWRSPDDYNTAHPKKPVDIDEVVNNMIR
tara:strand:+ start:4557 stop:5027 length:471 start_codon:yes stop_codon:yes gene_type:complete